jgi:hypothetical protein
MLKKKRFGGTAANEGMLGVLSEWHLHRNSKLKVAIVSALSSIVAGLWRLFIMPLDTCKTVLQVDGNKGFNIILSKVYDQLISPPSPRYQ